MTLDDITRLTTHEIRTVELGPPWSGDFRVDGKWADLHLGFVGEELESFTLSQIDGVASAQISPRTNLCTGELTFFIYLNRTTRLQGWEVLLDGKPIPDSQERGALLLELHTGSYEIQAVKPGHEPVVLRLNLGNNDAGGQSVTLGKD